jgi:hypothetical protein
MCLWHMVSFFSILEGSLMFLGRLVIDGELEKFGISFKIKVCKKIYRRHG